MFTLYCQAFVARNVFGHPNAAGGMTDLSTVVVLILLQSSLQNFQPQRQWSITVLPPMGPEILYTTDAGEGVKVSVVNFPSSGGGV